MNYWLLKTEPGTYSFAQLLKDKKTHWNGVRNYQARIYLRQIKKGDLALIYHSGDERAVVGLAEITREAYEDPDPEKPGDWVQVDLKAVKPLASPVSLKMLKSETLLKSLLLIKNSRLSVMPVAPTHFEKIISLSGSAK